MDFYWLKTTILQQKQINHEATCSMPLAVKQAVSFMIQNPEIFCRGFIGTFQPT